MIIEVLQEAVQQTFFERNYERFLASIITSAVFLFALSRLKPRLKICDKISMEEEEGKPTYYGFKIINKSWFFRIYDIRVSLLAMEKLPSENNTDYACTPITMRKKEQWYLNSINLKHLFQDFFHKEKRLESRTDYAVQFFTKENIKDLVESKQSIRFEVLAKHSLSGFSTLKAYEFRHKNDVIKGSFFSGNTSKIKE